MNSLINFHPEAIVKPYKRDSSLIQGVFVPSNGGSLSQDTRMCPLTALPYAKVNIPSTNTDYQSFKFTGLTPFRAAPDDTWMVSVYIPKLVDGLVIQLLMSKNPSISGTDYRWFTWSSNQLQQGYNVLSALHAEDYIDSTTFGHVGTHHIRPWGEGSYSSSQDKIESLTVRIKKSIYSEDVNISFGSIYKARSGWAKSCVCWMVDDVPQCFTDIALPIFEEFGWKVTAPTITQFSSDPRGRYTPLEQIRTKYLNKGHEIWNHLRQHEDMNNMSLADKVRAFDESKQYWQAQGISTAAKMGAWPHGHYDAEAIQVAKDFGYKLCRTTTQGTVNPLIPAVNPYTYSGISGETPNSWQTDSLLNGVIKRGESLLIYLHNAVAGGEGIDVFPGPVSFYEAHLRRWCEFLKEKEEKGLVVIDTVSGFFSRVGVNPIENDFLE